MRSFRPGDVVFARYPREETPSIKDSRPCLILGSNDRGDFLAVKMTSTSLDRVWAYQIPKGAVCASKGSIKYDSWLNLNRREWIPPEDIVFWCATLKPEVFSDILSRFKHPEG